MSSERTLTATEILAASTSEMVDAGGYVRVSDEALKGWPFSNSRLFEDRFGIVAIVIFETWEELQEEWPEAQAALSQLMSRYMGRSEPKSWDGYLILLTPGIRGASGQGDWMRIRYDTSRVRKLVATGEDLRSLGDVRSILIPLLPLGSNDLDLPSGRSVLDLLPPMLSRSKDVDISSAEVVVSAFRKQKNMVQALHRHRGGDR